MRFIYTGDEPTQHALLGRIEPGLNDRPRASDEPEVRKLLETGRSSGQFLPADAAPDAPTPEALAAAVTSDEAARPKPRFARGAAFTDAGDKE